MKFLTLQTPTVVNLLSVLTIAGQIIAVLLLIILLKNYFRASKSNLSSWIERHALVLMFIVALTAMAGSLYFSEIAGWTPCKDCWFQRIFLYPQVVLLGIALWKRDRNIAIYILILSLIGIGLSIDHYADQVAATLQPVPDTDVVNALLKPCDASGVSCAKTEIRFSYSYITIPMMAMTASLLNAIGSLFLLRKK